MNHYDTETTKKYDYNNDYDDIGPNFESGNPYVIGLSETSKILKSCMHEEVISKSFLFMFAALIITAVTSLSITPSSFILLMSNGRFYIFIGAELLIVFLSNYAIKKNNALLAGILFIAYSCLNGITLSLIFMIYTTASIFYIFVTTAVLFAIMAIIGLVTKTDLSKVGNLCIMGLFGIIIMSFVNIFLLKSDSLDFAISIVAVLIFVGLTAYDTQKIKKMATYSNEQNVLTLSLFGAFQLYLDFINLFLYLLRIFGKRK
ncbi:Bax inhibitor-1/YccA family protein [Anaerosacchariphilus polymeriproducens]|uniref:BAX inhibitor (BI)-1/YccA family protein n=1 Tax=Anaerosacchariphilus polymeriproducens TaxID=1812858 RepID=A0A371AQW6_9FIRM|nr:Bax inhibitor-1/YccA family protein [Anaerosacchariphilus polymeriproducens]RDU21966.1 BAX inhibitor (BI)-1/YccA family protein [Anaerosacchariphilus polymeriproducens]